MSESKELSASDILEGGGAILEIAGGMLPGKWGVIARIVGAGAQAGAGLLNQQKTTAEVIAELKGIAPHGADEVTKKHDDWADGLGR